MDIASKLHVRDKTSSHIGANISGGGAYHQKVDIFDGALCSMQTGSDRPATGLHRPFQVAIVQIAGRLFARLCGIHVKMPGIDIAIAEDLQDARAGIASHLELLRPG